MVDAVPLVGRQREREWLGAAVTAATEGSGGLVLLAGEAGVGKTRLAEEALRGADARFLRGSATPAAPPYGPIVTVLRAASRSDPAAFEACGPLRAHLALLLPELGEAPASSDRATLFEAIRCALATIAGDRPASILLDDLQWSDGTTLELLASVAGSLTELPLLLVAAYRSDECPRGHPVRRLRSDLRRARLLRELTVDPLDPEDTAELAGQLLGGRPAPGLAAILHERTQGVPFFIEELAAALRAEGRLEPGPDGVELNLDAQVPLPETVRDAVLLQLGDLGDAARAAAEVAAIAGPSFELDAVAGIAEEAGLAELLESGLIAEAGAGRAAFRHPLAREAIYEDVPWLRRRALHRELAEGLAGRGGFESEVASHWLAAREDERARGALIDAVGGLAAVHAYRDAARLGRQALELWPDGERVDERIAFLERYGRWAELAGEFAEAARAQREVVAAHRSRGAGKALGEAGRRLAGIYELQGDRQRALQTRRVAADAFADSGFAGGAAAERLIAASHLTEGGSHTEAIELACAAGEEALRAERVDLRGRALALEGDARARRGEIDRGIEAVRAGLSLALEHDLTLVAAEAYQRLGTALQVAADYGGAQEALTTALGLCEGGGDERLEHSCVSCVVYVLRELGEWKRADELADELRPAGSPAHETFVADGVRGSIHAFRGEARRARPLLLRCFRAATRIGQISMQLDSAAALALLEEQEGAVDAARGQCAFLLEVWERSEDHHYAVWGLRWAASFHARRRALADARACAEALSAIASASGHSDALAALAHALAETALAEGDADAAAEQLERAVELHAHLEIPFERAQIQLRAGVACALAGERERALEHLRQAHRSARRLGARPLALEAAAEVTKLGESVEKQLGRRAAAEHDNGGLSRREVEVIRLVAAGQTNRQIAAELVLSTRTVDMHVRNILAKLRCRTRTEAASKAAQLGVLD